MPVGLKPVKAKATKLTVDAVRRIVKEELDDASSDALRDLVETTATWEHKPAFRRRATKDGVEISTDSDIFRFVDEGTKPHTITARNAPRLMFQTGYTAKTTPGNIMSRAGGRSGPWRGPISVQHPGIEARNFSKIIQERRGKIMQKRIDARIKKLT